MNLIHVTDPAVNYYPMYSVEFIKKGDPYNCWSQHALTPSKFMMRFLAFEVWMRYGRTHNRRVRVL